MENSPERDKNKVLTLLGSSAPKWVELRDRVERTHGRDAQLKLKQDYAMDYLNHLLEELYVHIQCEELEHV